MAITYEDAVAKVHEWTDNPALRNHARGVEAVVDAVEPFPVLVLGLLGLGLRDGLATALSLGHSTTMSSRWTTSRS